MATRSNTGARSGSVGHGGWVVVLGPKVRRISLLNQALLAAIAAGMLLLAVVPHAAAQTYEELPDDLEERAQGLYSTIMCPQCAGQTIGQSSAEIANIMRDVVRERLLAGETDQEIVGYLVEAFGENVLASPPKSGASLAVWMIPPVALILGALGVLLAVRGLRKQAATVAPEDSAGQPAEGDLDPYLALVDEELGDDAQPPNGT